MLSGPAEQLWWQRPSTTREWGGIGRWAQIEIIPQPLARGQEKGVEQKGHTRLHQTWHQFTKAKPSCTEEKPEVPRVRDSAKTTTKQEQSPG